MKRAVIIGPRPPAIGGISTIVSMLMDAFGDSDDFIFIDSSKSELKLAKIIRPFRLFFLIFTVCLFKRCKQAMFFSSAFMSFWEKCVWGFVISLFGIRPLMVMVDGNFPNFFDSLSSFKKNIAKFMLSRIVIVAQSPIWASYYSEIFNKLYIPVVSGGVKVEFFTPNVSPLKQPDVMRLLFVGWVCESKGVYDLIEALRLVAETRSDFLLKLVGPLSEEGSVVDRMIREGGLSNNVQICGPIYTRERLRREYHAADIFVFPTHFEGFPVALLEAIACGLPCICTKVGGIPDILDNGNCGILVDRRCPHQLADAILGFMLDRDQLKLISAKSRERAITYYSMEESIGSYLKILGEVG